jgi:hypothetical protein
MPRQTVKLLSQLRDSHDSLASYQLQAELQSCVKRDESRMQDARRRLLVALASDFPDSEPTLRPSRPLKRPPLEHQHPRPSKRPRSRGPIDRPDLGGMPSDPRAVALRESTQSSRTQWPNERSNVPPIREADRAHYQKWLESSGFPAASNPKICQGAQVVNAIILKKNKLKKKGHTNRLNGRSIYITCNVTCDIPCVRPVIHQSVSVT